MYCNTGVIHGGQINYGSVTVLGSEIWILHQMDQPVKTCKGNIEPFFLDEAKLISIFSFLAKVTLRDLGNQKPIPVPIYSFKQVPAGHSLGIRLYLAKRCNQFNGDSY